MLPKTKELQTRAYVARFLKPFDLPQEFFIDPVLSDLYQQLQQQQQAFKETHKTFIKNQDVEDPVVPVDVLKRYV